MGWTMKTCTKCGQSFPRTREFFHLHPIAKDGLKPRCKSCQCAAQRKRLSVMDINDKREIWRKYKPTIERHVEINADWRKRNPEKYRAHWTVRNAIARGTLVPQPCEECGAPAHAHHDDYSKPLDVRWLCAFHHGQHHRTLNAIARGEEQPTWTS